MPRTNVMSVIPEPETSQKSSLSSGSSLNCIIWIFGIFISILPLLIIPIIKLFTQINYSDWLNDIFNNMEILMVCVTMAVTAIFDFIVNRRSIINGDSRIAFCCLSTLIIFCSIIYTVLRVLDELRVTLIFKLTPINAFLFFVVFMFSILLFINPTYLIASLRSAINKLCYLARKLKNMIITRKRDP